MPERGAEWPNLVSPDQDGYLFGDDREPPSFVHAWYDQPSEFGGGDTVPGVAVTLYAYGPIDKTEVDLMLASDRDDDPAADDRLDAYRAVLSKAGARAITLYKNLGFDPRHTDRIDPGASASEARELARQVFEAAGIEKPTE